MMEKILLLFFFILPFSSCVGQINYACSDTAGCPTQATCSKTGYESCDKGKCKCPTGYIVSGSICKRKLNYNEDCSDTTKTYCSSPFQCISQKCACTSSYEIDPSDSKTCVRKDRKNIGEACTSSIHCTYGNGKAYSSCDSGTKKCTCGIYKADSTNKCVKKNYGESCTSILACVSGLICSGGKCTCSTSLKWDSSTSTCIRYQYQEDCQSGKLCDTSKGLTCLSNACNCLTTQKWDSSASKCIYYQYQDQCPSPKVCDLSKGLICSGGACACSPARSRWDATNKNCEYQDYGNPCSSVSLCKSGLSCLADSTCGCSVASKMVWDSSISVCRFYWHGESCDATKKCDLNKGLGCSSTTNKCDCSAGKRLWDSSKKECRRAKWRESCATADCDTTLNLFCSNKVCECQTNYVGHTSVYVSYWSGGSADPQSSTRTNICLYTATQKNLDVGAECNYLSPLSLKYCKEGLTCKINACPTVNNLMKNVCVKDPKGKSSASLLKLNVIVAFVSFICYYLYIH